MRWIALLALLGVVWCVAVITMSFIPGAPLLISRDGMLRTLIPVVPILLVAIVVGRLKLLRGEEWIDLLDNLPKQVLQILTGLAVIGFLIALSSPFTLYGTPEVRNGQYQVRSHKHIEVISADEYHSLQAAEVRLLASIGLMVYSAAAVAALAAAREAAPRGPRQAPPGVSFWSGD